MSARRGFTLLEVLAVLAITGMLASLLLVGVSALRESARQVQCTNNLRQIGLGLANYESAYKRLPAAVGGAIGASPFLVILPFVGQESLYATVDFNAENIYAIGPANGTQVQLYCCPSTLKPVPDFCRTDYVLNRGTTLAIERDDPWFIYDRGYPRLNQLSRGTSNTAMMSEVCPFIEGQRRGSLIKFPSRNVTTLELSNRFINECDVANHASPVCHSNINGQNWLGGGSQNYYHIFAPNYKSCSDCTSPQHSIYTAESMHSGGVNALYADGRVDFVSSTIDRDTWRELGKR